MVGNVEKQSQKKLRWNIALFALVILLNDQCAMAMMGKSAVAPKRTFRSMFGLNGKKNASKSSPPKEYMTRKNKSVTGNTSYKAARNWRGQKIVYEPKVITASKAFEGSTGLNMKSGKNSSKKLTRETSVRSLNLSRSNSSSGNQYLAVKKNTARAKQFADSVATSFMSKLSRVDSAVGFSRTCSTYITQPVTKAWFKARKLDSGKINFTKDVGLLNTKINNIIKSVQKMKQEGASSQQIGKFVSNSVQVILITPVIGVGATGGAFVGTAGGVVAGAVVAVGHGGPALMISPPVAAGVVLVGGTAGGVIGGFHGAKSGARYTSEFLRSPSKAFSFMRTDGVALPSRASRMFNPSAKTAKQPINTSQVPTEA